MGKLFGPGIRLYNIFCKFFEGINLMFFFSVFLIEVTDQNFKDEEARSSSMPLVKRLKTATADGSSSDQVE